MKSKIPYAEQWLVFEDYATLESTIKILHDLKIPEVRTLFSWADWTRPEGPKWFDHFTKRFHEENIRLLPCLFYTPPHMARTEPGEEGRTSYPPQRPADFGDFTCEMIDRYGHTFDWIQLWNESNWDVYWNWKKDLGWHIFAEMISGAIPYAKDKGKKIVLGGLSPYEAKWVDAMFDFGVMQHADAFGIHAFPGTWDASFKRREGREWRGLNAEIKDAREQLASRGSSAEIWLTETGYSTYAGPGETVQEKEQKQVEYFKELLQCKADRSYWHTLIDQKMERPTDDELNSGYERDLKAYFFGVVDDTGREKPIYSYWKDLAQKKKI